VSELANALCIFQRVLSWAWALASVAIAASIKADAPTNPSLKKHFDIA
jgi:hypothetical protein